MATEIEKKLLKSINDNGKSLDAFIKYGILRYKLTKKFLKGGKI